MKFVLICNYFFCQFVISATSWQNKLAKIQDISFKCPLQRGADSNKCPTAESETDSTELFTEENQEILQIVDCSEQDARLDYKIVVRGHLTMTSNIGIKLP
jgi:hypothetical protein